MRDLRVYYMHKDAALLNYIANHSVEHLCIGVVGFVSKPYLINTCNLVYI